MTTDTFAKVLGSTLVVGFALMLALAVSNYRDAHSNAVRSVVAVSFDHDGHRWVSAVGSRGGLAHHPDCPCHVKAERGAE